MNRLQYRKIISYLAVSALLVGVGWHAHGWYRDHYDRHKLRRVASHDFRFTSPLLDVELPEGIDVSNEPIPFKHKIVSLVQKQIDSGLVREVSVYYRDLLDGPWFGINENAEFNPASMMKVPVMIAWLKRAEKDPHVLKRSYTHDGKEDTNALQDIPPHHTITPGRPYTVEELLHYMMNYSDNNATTLLYRGLSATELNAVLDGMDVDNKVADDSNSISVHGYSGFFRILYNASYLSREMSENALALLSLQDFPQGIAAGVPEGTRIAAKFGELARERSGGEKQLHEFGIVYHPTRPYILGIMTRGKDFTNQQTVLGAISRMIYTKVDSNAARNGMR